MYVTCAWWWWEDMGELRTFSQYTALTKLAISLATWHVDLYSQILLDVDHHLLNLAYGFFPTFVPTFSLQLEWLSRTILFGGVMISCWFEEHGPGQCA